MKTKELQEKLEGVYDFDEVEDCKKVIGMLLRDLERANKRAEDGETRLKMLAFLVAKGRPNAEEKAQEILHGMPKNTKAEVWDMLMGMSQEMARAEGLSDEELLDDVTRTVWGDLDMHSRESAVLEELVRRYKDKAGIRNVVPDNVP